MRAIPSCLSVLAFAALAFAAPDAHAQFEAGAFGGVHVFNPTNRLGRYDRDPRATSYVSSGTFGGRFAYLPSRYVGGELQFAVVPTATRDDRTSATVIHLRGHVIGTLPLGRFRPFVLAGAGGASVIPADPTYLRRDTDLNFHGGVGTRFDVSKLWGVRLEAQTNAVPRTDQTGFAFEGAFLFGIYGNFPWDPEPELPFDKDHDQITDDKDECPDQAGDIKFGGCPDPDAKQEKGKDEEPAEEEKKGDAKPAAGAKP